MKKLFFDIQITGHHSEYINHLVDYLFANDDLTDEYFFVVHPDFSKEFPEIVFKAQQLSNVTWIEITFEEFDKSQRGGLIRSSFSLHRLMDSYANKYKVNHVFLLYFNSFQLPCIFYRPNYSMSGILFLQFYRMSRSSLKDKLKYYRKYYITKLYALNTQLKSVSLLNDVKTAEYLNREFNTTIFTMLPDPIPVLTPLEHFDIYEYYNIERTREIFLHIGSLGDRKGTFEIIEAAKYISNDKQSEIAILLVGKASDRESECISQNVEKAAEESQVTVLWDNQFVSSKMMKSLFDQCTAVLIPYKNAEASSGILGHAVAANKLVIATRKGLLKELVENNNLGITILEVNPKDIAKAIINLKDYSIDQTRFQSFKEKHNTNEFAEQIIMKIFL
ncbi:glycosyltransferase [Flavobacterium sp. LB2P74]|uniref:glycosyltransferase n=1 Tax=Flavobacterium sp. LB2P74 TaxID=3401717 RepID=UPI003AB076DC